MEKSAYGISRKLENTSDENAIERITAALKEQGFGVLTEIDVQATLKRKIDVDVDKYIILGACNPHYAHKAMQIERSLGLMLPCNVVVYAEGADAMVEVIDPPAMIKLVDNPAMADIADQVEKLLTTALENC